jgi:hypothetical protein
LTQEEGRFVRLATFVHVSDLHFGHTDPKTRDSQAIALASKFSIFDGLLGHSYKSLVRLEQVFDKFRREESASLIVTGDLTTVGDADEFLTASEYLGDVLRPPKGAYVGLRQRDWLRRAVPGNHDHWPGVPKIFGGPTAALAKTFGTLPQSTMMSLPSGHRIHFLRIDSDADVWPYGASRLFARGSFRSQLQNLSATLTVPAQGEIRVLLLHHSFAYAGATLSMNSSSRKALNDFIVNHNIAVLLCGHVHQPPSVSVLKASHLMQSLSFLEARCGTTTQVSTLPYDASTLLNNRPVRPDHWPNSLLVHRVLLDSGTLVWETEIHLERSTGFVLGSYLLSTLNSVTRFPLP